MIGLHEIDVPNVLLYRFQYNLFWVNSFYFIKSTLMTQNAETQQEKLN